MLLALGLLLLASFPLDGQDVTQLRRTGSVNDSGGVLSTQAVQQINQVSDELQRAADARVLVVTVRELGGKSAGQLADQLAERWRTVAADEDRTVIILVAVKDQGLGMYVGKPLEPLLQQSRVNDWAHAAAAKIRPGDYSQALTYLATQIAGAIAAEKGAHLTERPPPQPRVQDYQPPLGTPLLMLALLLFLIALPFAWHFGKKSAWVSDLISAWLSPNVGGNKSQLSMLTNGVDQLNLPQASRILHNAQDYLKAGNRKAASEVLGVFISEIKTKDGKELTAEQAFELIDWARKIQSGL